MNPAEACAAAAMRLATRGAEARGATFSEEGFARGLESAAVFVERFGGRLRCEGKDVLDVGCGAGELAVMTARRGARSVTGVDISGAAIDFARDKLQREYSDVADRVRLRRIDNLAELTGTSFDVILSKDSFEHFDDAAAIVGQVTSMLRPGGTLAVGFGPLWKSPYGGHLNYMTKVPWVHLLVPERVVMRERRRHTPQGELWDGAMRYEEITGGLNRMTLARMRQIMAETGLEPQYLATNLHHSLGKRIIGRLSRIPGLKEYFTFNVYSLWEARVTGRGRGDTPLATPCAEAGSSRRSAEPEFRNS